MRYYDTAPQSLESTREKGPISFGRSAFRSSQSLSQGVAAGAPAVAVPAAHRLGHPAVPDAPAALERDEAAVVRPVVPLEMHRVMEKPVDHRIDDRLLGAEPR